MGEYQLKESERWVVWCCFRAARGCLSALLLSIVFYLPVVQAQGADTASTRPDIINYIAYSETLASSGQPTENQLKAQAAAGVERVVYLAFTDHDTSLPNEDRITRGLGMQFLQVPVLWEAPTVGDFQTFAALMQEGADRRTLVHCQVNWRASSFSFLYRVIFNEVPMDDAVMDLASIWTPSDNWRGFIVEVLAAYGLAPDCEFCDLLRD